MAKQASVGIGIVGLGFMGLTHLRAARRVKGGRLRAIATSDPRKARGDFSRISGNFGEAGGREDLGGLDVHPTLESLLADSSVDLVDICLPSYLHAAAAIECLKGGKAVLVEKPMALSTADARRMLAASHSAGKPLMVAQVLRFFPEFTLVRDAVRDGRWGRLLALHLRRRISMPSWGNGSWFADPKLSGGMVVDLHIHDTDFIVHVFGRPRAVTSHGIVDEKGVNFLRTVYHHKEVVPLLSAEAGWINAPGLAFEHGYDAFFQNATLRFDSSHSPRPRLYTTTGKKMKELTPRRGDAFQKEIQAAVDSVRAGRVDPLLDPRTAADSLAVCLAEETSTRSGKRVAVPS